MLQRYLPWRHSHGQLRDFRASLNRELALYSWLEEFEIRLEVVMVNRIHEIRRVSGPVSLDGLNGSARSAPKDESKMGVSRDVPVRRDLVTIDDSQGPPRIKHHS